MINNYTEVLNKRQEIIDQIKKLTKEFAQTTVGNKLKIECNLNKSFEEPKINVNDSENY